MKMAETAKAGHKTITDKWQLLRLVTSEYILGIQSADGNICNHTIIVKQYRRGRQSILLPSPYTLALTSAHGVKWRNGNRVLCTPLLLSLANNNIGPWAIVPATFMHNRTSVAHWSLAIITLSNCLALDDFWCDVTCVGFLRSLRCNLEKSQKNFLVRIRPSMWQNRE